MADELVAFTKDSARLVNEVVSIVLGTQPAPPKPAQPTGGNSCIIVKPVSEDPIELQWITSTFEITAHTIDGDIWASDKTVNNIRNITNGLRIAHPTSEGGLCTEDSEFWAVNIGTSDAPSNAVDDTDGIVLSGHGTGVAGLFIPTPEGGLKVSDERLTYIRRDDGDDIEDGTLICLGYVSGTLTLKFSNCSPTDGLTGLEAAP